MRGRTRERETSEYVKLKIYLLKLFVLGTYALYIRCFDVMCNEIVEEKLSKFFIKAQTKFENLPFEFMENEFINCEKNVLDNDGIIVFNFQSKL